VNCLNGRLVKGPTSKAVTVCDNQNILTFRKIFWKATPPAGDNEGMPKKLNLPNLSALVRERLTSLGATQLPAAALAQLERDALLACRRAVACAITAPRVGRAVAAALAPSGATEQGLKGGTPLTSSFTAITRESVAGLTHSNEETLANQHVPGGVVQPIKEAT